MSKKILFVGFILLLVLGACSSNKDQTVGSSPPQTSKGDALPREIRGAGKDEVQTDESQTKGGSLRAEGQLPSEPLPPIPPGGDLSSSSRVIKNATLSVRVEEGTFQNVFDRATKVAGPLGGFVSTTSIRSVEGEDASSGKVTLRVPSDKFDEAVSALRNLGEVTSEDQSAQEVTQEFVDLEARLRHAKSQEAFYVRLMEKATTIADLIQIQQQLSDVQLQIEQIQGRLQFLKDQTDFSTVTAEIFEPGAGPAPARGTLALAWEKALDSFRSVVSGLIVAMGWIAPLALLGLAGVIGWRIFRKPKPVSAETG